MSDAMKYRTKTELEEAKHRDPITLYEVRLREAGILNDDQIQALQDEVNNQVDEDVAQAEADPHPPLEDRFNDALTETYPYEPE